jgi:hypothetical protein
MERERSGNCSHCRYMQTIARSGSQQRLSDFGHAISPANTSSITSEILQRQIIALAHA